MCNTVGKRTFDTADLIKFAFQYKKAHLSHRLTNGVGPICYLEPLPMKHAIHDLARGYKNEVSNMQKLLGQ